MSDREAEGWVVVRGAATGFPQKISIGAHRLRSDEPTAAGRTDTGPTPYDLLLVGLGSCTSMTVAACARRKEWPLEAVTIRLRHSRIHAEDCAERETKDGMLDRIEREIVRTGPLTDDQRTQLLGIANRWHRTLTSEIKIDSRLE